jgi:hypothetical protein
LLAGQYVETGLVGWRSFPNRRRRCLLAGLTVVSALRRRRA